MRVLTEGDSPESETTMRFLRMTDYACRVIW